MIRLQIKPAFAELLQSHRLGSYAAIMHTDAGETIEDNDERDVRRLQLDGQTLYLKRTRQEKITSAFESYARGRLAHSKPFKEMLQYQYLADREFVVAEVVACGEALSFGIPRRGFIITAEAGGVDMAQVYRAADSADRVLLLGQFGALLGRLHDHGFFGSTRLKDVIYATQPRGQPILTLIDRETRNPYPKRATTQRVAERLLFNIRRQSQQGEIFSEREWQAFCQSYCAALSADIDLEAATLLRLIVDMLERRGKLGPAD